MLATFEEWLQESGKFNSGHSPTYFAACSAVSFNKDLFFCAFGWKEGGREEKEDISLCSVKRRTHSITVKYSLPGPPCSRPRSSTGVLQRPICLADHCLFDVAANVTFLFQSKTQQGVPSVWHSLPLPSPMPFCADHFTWQFVLKPLLTLAWVNFTFKTFLKQALSYFWVQ